MVLNQADDLWDSRRPGADPGWVYWMPQPSLTAEAGTALLDIGDLGAAERSLTAGLSTLDSNSARDRNLYLVRLAEVQLRGGRLDEAAATARQAIDAAADIDSCRVHARVAHPRFQLGEGGLGDARPPGQLGQRQPGPVALAADRRRDQ